ncbi:MAG: transcriptional repressor LexA [Clostridium sp.]|nr:transcriptional repressor LexA [Clostridium sp.]
MPRRIILNENGLTHKEQAVLDYIIERQEQMGYPPAVREICQVVNLKSTSSVQHYLDSLEKKGYLRRDPSKPRALEILKTGSKQAAEPESDAVDSCCEIIHAPIIGDVAAGTPILAQQNIDGYYPLPADEFGGRDVYMLRVHGDSMINAGIYDGDKVIVETCDTAENGEIVVALVEDSATVKRFYAEDGRYRLQPENDTMQPMYFDNVRIQGKVIGLLRSMR